MFKFIKVLPMLPLIVACGGGSDSGDSASLSDIAGVWDISSDTGFGEDQAYIVIHDYGDLIIYDYDGDEFDDGEDCFYKVELTISDLGGGLFEIDFEDGEYSTGNISVSDTFITFYDSEGSISYPKSTLIESDFTPLCEDYSTTFSLQDSSLTPKKYSLFNVNE